MMTASLRPRSSNTHRPRLPALWHAGSFGRYSGSTSLAWLLLAVGILVLSRGTSAMPATAVKGHETVEVDLGAQLDAGDGAVVTLVAGKTRLAVHRAVLAARSTVFAAKFADDPLKTSSGEFLINDVQGPVLRKLVAFLYSGRVPHLSGMTPQLLQAAKTYAVSGLQDAFELQQAKHLTVYNAGATAVLAVTNDYPTLRKAAVAFIRAHVFQVMDTPGWAQVVHSHPGVIVQLAHLFVEATTETSTPTTVHSAATPSTQSNSDDGRTPAAALLCLDCSHNPTRDDATVTHLSAATPAGSVASPTSQPDSNHGRSPAATTPSWGCPNSAPLNDAYVSNLRNLPPKEKGRRLIQAGRNGPLQEVRALLAAGADVRARDAWALTALHYATYWGHLDAARCLLQAGADVNATESVQWTPLHEAAATGHAAVVRLLLAASADLNAKEERGWTALHFAASRGHEEAATALLEAGADRGATTNKGETPLSLAREKGHQRLIQMLET